MSEKSSLAEDIWYWTRVVICVVSFGMIFPNILTERMEKEDLTSGNPG